MRTALAKGGAKRSAEFGAIIMTELAIENLHVEVDGKEILKGVSLSVPLGKVVAIMGPNGSGKSTLANTIMGHPKYNVTSGKILVDGEDVTRMAPDLRARKGLFLSFQYPKEISGLTLGNFLRTALNARREEKIGVVEFHKLLKEKMIELDMDASFRKRSLNEGFSGGEKKRCEILQMLVLEPTYAILDETDSGLDVDALKIVAAGIQKMRSPDRGLLIITHYNRILDYLTPDVVCVMKDGKIVKTGGAELAREIEEKGFAVVQ